MLKRTLWTIILAGGLCLRAGVAPRTVERIDAYRQDGKNIVLLVLASGPLTEDATVSDADRQLILLADAPTGRPLKLAAAAGSGNTIALTLAAGESVDPHALLLIRFARVPFGAKPENVVEIKDATFKPQPPPGTTPQKLTLKGADGRSDAWFYFDGEIAHVRKGDLTGSYDLKLSHVTYKRALGMVLRYGPFFTLQGGNQAGGDPDSMRMGAVVTMPFLVGEGSPKLFSGLLWEHAPQIESTRDFTYSNFVYSSVFRLVSRSWTSTSGRRAYFRPFAGVDVGRNLSTTVSSARDQTVLRPLAGSALNLVLFKTGDVSVSVTGDYIRRWPLYNEVLLKTDYSGNLKTVSAGTEPRDHLKAALALNLTEFVGVSTSYERGSLPPAFAFVDNKWTLSLVIKAKK